MNQPTLLGEEVKAEGPWDQELEDFPGPNENVPSPCGGLSSINMAALSL